MVDGFIAIMNVATMKLDRRCFFMVYTMDPIRCSYSHIDISQYDLSQNTVLSPSLRSYFVDRCVKQFPKCESNSSIVRIKRDKTSCDLLNIYLTIQ